MESQSQNPETRIHPENFHPWNLLDMILYVQSTIFQLNRDGSSWVEPVVS